MLDALGLTTGFVRSGRLRGTERQAVRHGSYRASMAMCQVCLRSLLAGERYRTWRASRRDQTVCVVCEPTVRDLGWVRVVDAYEQVRVTGLTQTVRRVA